MSVARRYWPALDGVRAIGIVTVVVYHLGHLGGGWIGVDIFFVLSGYLITTLLLAERVESGRTSLGRFWGRRARRLLPGVLLLLTVLGVYAWAGGPGLVPAQLRAPAIATLLYFANWQQIAFSHNYFAAFSAPTPLVHTWSLAIEEQYYVFWPLLVVAVGALVAARARRRGRPGSSVPAGGAPRALLWVTALLLVCSAVAMGVTAHLGDVNRAYLGTDTRAWELLLGGVAAMVVRPTASERRPGRWAAASVVAALGLATVIGLASATGQSGAPGSWIWDGGLVTAGVCATTLIIGSIRAPRGPVARVLSLGPVRWLGRVSYSLYLWHWPVIDLVNPLSVGFSGAGLLALRLGLMLLATCASYYLVELPLRRASWTTWRRRLLVPLGIGTTAAVVLAATVAPPLAATAPLPSSAGQPSTGAPVVQSPITPASFRAPFAAPTTADPLRAWILGDSVMEDSSLGVTAALQATGRVQVVANSSFGGWGLTTTNWAAQSAQVISEFHPQVILGTWSWDDGLAARHPVRYEGLLERAMADWLRPGSGVELVVLLQFPQTGPDTRYLANPAVQHRVWVTQNAEQDDWDTIARDAVAAFPGHAVYLATSQLFAPGGRFFTWFRSPVGSWVRARKVDNTHFCPYGAAALGQLVVDDLGTPLGLGKPASGWQFGTWTKDARFDDPPGACPADQPPAHYRGVPIPRGTTRKIGRPS